MDPSVEREFVHRANAPEAAPQAPAQPFARAPISIRIRSEYADALKRASLERQLNKVEPKGMRSGASWGFLR